MHDVVIVVVVVVIIVATTMYMYIFFHFNCCSCLCPDCDGVYRYATLCRCRSFSSFLRFFFSIRLTLAMVNALCCLSLSFLLCYNPLYSRTLMSFLLCTFVFCFDACHMYFFEVMQKSKLSRHFYTGKSDSLFFWHWLNIIGINR